MTQETESRKRWTLGQITKGEWKMNSICM